MYCVKHSRDRSSRGSTRCQQLCQLPCFNGYQDCVTIRIRGGSHIWKHPTLDTRRSSTRLSRKTPCRCQSHTNCLVRRSSKLASTICDTHASIVAACSSNRNGTSLHRFYSQQESIEHCTKHGEISTKGRLRWDQGRSAKGHEAARLRRW
jgi:hypothetical protein